VEEQNLNLKKPTIDTIYIKLGILKS